MSNNMWNYLLVISVMILTHVYVLLDFSNGERNITFRCFTVGVFILGNSRLDISKPSILQNSHSPSPHKVMQVHEI